MSSSCFGSNTSFWIDDVEWFIDDEDKIETALASRLHLRTGSPLSSERTHQNDHPNVHGLLMGKNWDQNLLNDESKWKYWNFKVNPPHSMWTFLQRKTGISSPVVDRPLLASPLLCQAVAVRSRRVIASMSSGRTHNQRFLLRSTFSVAGDGEAFAAGGAASHHRPDSLRTFFSSPREGLGPPGLLFDSCPFPSRKKTVEQCTVDFLEFGLCFSRADTYFSEGRGPFGGVWQSSANYCPCRSSVKSDQAERPTAFWTRSFT
ncbi:unnamed protein product [Nesidiocoris tenuis]|uniref:Uncharacterized protein n=1 Tax=Nesidiocoris tenuis TaxID=355587 RepID=A0A6H5G4T4_9HEMI|nr:unnamed protein product [Nesidiocoris tenuis]